MGSRFFIGVGAWLLGAVAATAGSLYAVAQLGQGLIGQRSSQDSVAMVNAQLAQDRSAPATRPALGASPTHSPKSSRSSVPPHPGRRHQSAPPAYSSKVFSSLGGTAEASCGPDGVQLLYGIAAQGFAAHVEPGPGAVASVTFTSASVGVTIKVTCDSSGIPVGQVTKFQRGSWGPHHDE